jgi:hypothetical protein
MKWFASWITSRLSCRVMANKFYVIDSSMSIICSFLYFFFSPLHVLPTTYVLFVVNILAHDQKGGYILWNVHVKEQIVDNGS